ncbi:SDR family NAD(P)-dependent oxidoreductase [Thermogemmatispora carboxidivorans]|jgi:NAD(P)-dependent dehydrogenase (short-subunit alcohol dehydrogenase family)|uniref:SDR family NAD(P)-dependent oxidoreductase n=1 Tax=Thermogemmatispora carboxidivorans TaxID=1382306 RepID=UPI00069CA383|nr:SDR family oxidoreductase [Thermogemmatispora carboxidivorans]
MLLQEKVAVITGGGRGIGRAIALAYAQAGARLALAARSVTALEETRRMVSDLGGEAVVIPTDVSEATAVAGLAQAVQEHFGRVDILVNNSGAAGPTAPLWEITPDAWEETFAVNVRGTFLCCRALLPLMIAQASGCILCIGSMTGKRPLFGRTPYAASKLALVGLARTLAWEVGPYGIRVNVISPGPVEGERIEQVIRKQAEVKGISLEEARATFLRDAPLGRLVTAEEVAAAAVFLASEQAASITGEDLNVSAGIVMY